MPIPTNSPWTIENAKLVKRPLYLVIIEGVSEPLTTFRPDDTEVVWGGYGIGGYGINEYGY
jgi:hypothetical protein